MDSDTPLSHNDASRLLSTSPEWIDQRAGSSPSASRLAGSPARAAPVAHEPASAPFEDADLTPLFFDPLFACNQDARVSSATALVDRLWQSAASHSDAQRLLSRAHLHAVLRLAHDCPFPSVREAFRDLVSRIKDLAHPDLVFPPYVGLVSTFVSAAAIPPAVPDDPRLLELFQTIFSQTGRVNHYQRVMAYHRSYLDMFYTSHSFVMKEPGPVPVVWRQYIGIMAVSRNKSAYFCKLQEELFLRSGGDPEWLQGVEKCPKKLQNLYELNALLAHRPWLISAEHISKLVRGADAWSMAELSHAMVIMSTFHALCGFAFGFGITPEVDCEHDHEQFQHIEPVDGDKKKVSEDIVKNTMDLLQILTNKPAVDDSEDHEERQEAFKTVETDDDQDNASQYSLDDDDMFAKYTQGLGMAYVDFDVRSKEYGLFRFQDYSWSEHGYELLEQFYSGAGPLLDEQFTHTYNLTYSRLKNSEGVDSTPFRNAVWHYVHRLFGIFHDDYNYRQVNVFLNRSIKQFVKKMVCFPDTVRHADFINMAYDLDPSEKCHVNILCLEARKQAGLLFGLRALNAYVSGER